MVGENCPQSTARSSSCTGKVSISLDEDSLIQFALDLNEYVVCLDRIMSRLGTGQYSPQILADYISGRDVMYRMALLREFVCDSLEEKIGSEAMEELMENGYFYQDPP